MWAVRVLVGWAGEGGWLRWAEMQGPRRAGQGHVSAPGEPSAPNLLLPWPIVYTVCAASKQSMRSCAISSATTRPQQHGLQGLGDIKKISSTIAALWAMVIHEPDRGSPSGGNCVEV